MADFDIIFSQIWQKHLKIKDDGLAHFGPFVFGGKYSLSMT